ncbi:MAG TPA: response regulator transcription factor [Trichormus sp.]|jgi:OmpR-family two-component system manganese-sensing response regulator
MARILLADDDSMLCDMIADGLSLQGYTIDVVGDGNDAMAFVRSHTFDLLILDWGLPGMTGLEICRNFRQMGKAEPVLFLTGKTDISDKEQGLNSGADDYLTKPFDMRELIVRVRSLLRRPANYFNHLAKIGDVEIDLDARQLRQGEKSLHLQPRELALLEFFLRRPGQVLGSEALLSGVWGSDFDGSEVALRSCLAKLRKALASLGYDNVIETVHGFGYRFKPPSA